MSLRPSTFKVDNISFNKKINVPSSKSYANRLLVLAAIKKEDVTVRNIPLSSDVKTMVSCLEKIGLTVNILDNEIQVKGSFPECERTEGCSLETGDGGTTNRFLIPLLARGSQEYEIIPEGHMRSRPMGPMIESLKDLGCKTQYNSADGAWIKVQGPYLSGKRSEVDCSSSTQFLTGLSLATVDLDVEIVARHLEVSLPYWELTLNLLKQFKANQLNFENPVDFSSLTYPLALAAVEGEVVIENAKEIDSFQADSAFIDILKRMGANIGFTSEGLHCKHNELNRIEFDGSQCPDAIPTLLYVCSFASGKSRIYNLEVLTHKECDRFQEMIRILKAFGVNVEVDEKNYEIVIHGQSASMDSVDFTPEKDHRMVMVAYLFMRSLGGGVLHNADHVAKSFSNFFEVMS